MTKPRRTNAEGTCLFCGERLPILATDRDAIFREANESEEAFLCRVRDWIEDGWVVTSERYRFDGEGGAKGGASVTYVRRKNPRRGVLGLGLFHSQGCARDFGYAFARAGYRLKPKDDEEEGERT